MDASRTYKRRMNKQLILITGLALSLGACGRGADDKTATPQPKSTAAAKPAPVSYDPAFKDIAGTWLSGSDAIGGGKILRIDVASGGGYSIDVRLPGTPEQVMETGRGSAKAAGTGVSATPDGKTSGATLKGLGAWKATVVDRKSMSLTGADGKRIELTYKGL